MFFYCFIYLEEMMLLSPLKNFPLAGSVRESFSPQIFPWSVSIFLFLLAASQLALLRDLLVPIRVHHQPGQFASVINPHRVQSILSEVDSDGFSNMALQASFIGLVESQPGLVPVGPHPVFEHMGVLMPLLVVFLVLQSPLLQARTALTNINRFISGVS